MAKILSDGNQSSVEDFELISKELELVGLKEINTPSIGFNLIIPSQDHSVIYSNEYGVVICNKTLLEVAKATRLLNTRVKSLAYSEHENKFYLGDTKGTVHIYHSLQYTEEKKYQLHMGSINKLILSFDELLLYSCSDSSEVSVLDLHAFKSKVLYTHDTPVRSMDVSPDGEVIGSGGANCIKLYSIMDDKLIGSIDTKNATTNTLKFSPDSTKIVTGDNNGDVKVWDTKTFDPILIASHLSEVFKVWYGINYIISADNAKTIKIHSTQRDTKPLIIEMQEPISDLLVDNNTLYILRTGFLTFMDLPTVPQTWVLKSHAKAINSIVYSSKKKLFFTISSEKKVCVWNCEDFSLVRELVHEGVTICICLSGDQKFLYVSQDTKIITKWNLDEFSSEIFATPEISARDIVCSPDNSYLISIDSSCKCIVRNIIDKKKIWYFSNHRLSGCCVTIAYLSNIFVTSGRDKSLYFYELGKGKKIGRLEGLEGDISRIRISRDDRFVGVTTRIGKVYIISIDKKAVVKELSLDREWTSDLYFTQDTKYLIVSASDANGSELYFYFLAGFSLLTKISSLSQCLGFTLINDEKYIVSGDEENAFIRENPLKIEKFCVLNHDQNYSIEYLKYVDSIQKGLYTKHNPNMDKYIFLPSQLNSLHLYAYYNLGNHLEKALELGSTPYASGNGQDIMSISLLKAFPDNIKIILNYVVKSLKKNPYAACFLENSFIELTKKPCSEVYDLYEAIYFKASDLSLPKFSIQTQGVFKSSYFEINPDLVTKPEATGNSIVFYQTGIKINNEIGSQESIQYMKSLLSAGNNQIFRSKFIDTLLNDKWARVKIFAVFLTIFYSGYLVILSLYTLKRNWEYMIVLVIQNLFLIMYGIYEIGLEKYEYIKKIWNIFDLLRGIIFILYFSLTPQYSELLFFLNFFSWGRGLAHFRVFSSTRHMVNLILEVIKDILPFLVLLLYFTFGFTFMLASLEDSESYSNIQLLEDTYLLNLGSFWEADRSLHWICFVISTLINFLVMANLLISIIGDTYDKVETFKDIADRRAMAETILEIEELMFWKREIKDRKYFHVVSSDSQAQGSQDWEGKVRQLQNMISGVQRNLTSNQTQIMDKFTEIKDDISLIRKKLEAA